MCPISEILPRLYLWHFHCEGCGDMRLRATQMQRNFDFGLMPCLASFLCSNSILYLLVPARDSFYAIIRHTQPFPSAYLSRADEATAALNSCYSTSASALHSGSSRNKDLRRSFLRPCPPGSPTLFGRTS